MQRRNGWKQKNLSANFMSGMSGDLKQQDRSSVDACSTIVPVAVQGVYSAGADRLLYTLEAGEVGGIFNLERFVPINISGTSPPEYPQKTQEKRLFYSADFKVDRVDFHPDD